MQKNQKGEWFTVEGARENFLWVGLLLFIYSLIWISTLNIYPSISPGDMGRDLYIFQMILEGKWPCRDYWWQYGPVAPLYYAFWFLVGGVNLVSARIGLGLIYLVLSVLAYQTFRLFISPRTAFLFSLAFLNLSMSWSFNHIVALPFLLISIFSLWKFFLNRQIRWCYWGLLAVGAIALVKSNTGLVSFLAYYVSLLFFYGYSRWKHSTAPMAWKHFIFLPALFAVLTVGGYAIAYWGLPLDRIDQCMSLNPKYHGTDFHSPWTNFKYLIMRLFVWERSRLWGIGAFLILAILGCVGLKKRERSAIENKMLPAVIGSLLLFTLAYSVEYFTTDGAIHRLEFWLFPSLALGAGFLAEWASALFGRRLKVFWGIILFLMITSLPFRNLKQAFADKVPERYLNFPNGQVYLGGPLATAEVLKKGTQFIIENTKPTEEILAIPYDPLYCFLSGRRHAVRDLQFLINNRLSEKRQEEIIRTLENKQVPLVLISNRALFDEPGLGHFGKTHCQKMAQYIFDHFEEVETFGSWTADNPFHAVKFFRRKPSG